MSRIYWIIQYIYPFVKDYFVEKVKKFFQSMDWIKLLLIISVIKSILQPSSYADAAILLFLASYVGFNQYIFASKIRPLDEALRKELSEMRTKLNSLENREKIERMAAQQSTSTATPKRFF